MPETDIITVSQKIESEVTKERLIDIAKKYVPQNTGLILRTSSENATEEEIKEDIQELEEKWRSIKEKAKNTKKVPALIYDNMALIRRTAIDIIDRGLNRIIVNDGGIYREIKETLKNIKGIELELRNENLFNMYSLETQIQKINNRKILNGLYESLGQEENSVEIMRIVDKLDKIGVEAVKAEISKLGVLSEVTDKIIEFIQIKGSTDEVLQKLEALNISNEKYLKGVEELKEVVKYIRLFKMPEENFAIDLTIARGLDYYTGTVYETFLNDYRELGSVCSGGRYENLAENYTDKKLPGVGVSIGLTRLFYKLNELNIIKADKKSISDILIIPMTENMSVPLELGTELRKLKVNTEIYLNNKKIKAKMKYADKLEIPYVVVIGDNEIETNKVKVKEMATGEETECELDAKEILNVIRRK